MPQSPESTDHRSRSRKSPDHDTKSVRQPLEDQLQSLVMQTEQRERTARRRAVIYSLVPVVLAIALLFFSSSQIQQASQQLNSIREDLQNSQQQLDTIKQELAQKQEEINRSQQELEATRKKLRQAQADAAQAHADTTDLQKRLNELNRELENITEQLKYATDFKKYEFTGDLALSIKELFSRYPAQADLFSDIYGLQLNDIGWKLNGVSPEEGFDSSGFAAYALNGRGLLPISASATQNDLRQLLPSTDRPEVGDIVFYEAGYTMFYFEDENGTPFVVGMTPFGILALKNDFAPIRGYGRVEY
jgi:Skp family chaperone for outer membrane proteins